MLARRVGAAVETLGCDYPFAGIKEFLEKADLAFVNFEAVAGTLRRHIDKKYIFQVRPRALWGLARAGVDGVSLANNHIYDYFAPGVVETVERFRALGIAPMGAGANARQFFAPKAFWLRENWIAILALNDTEAGFWGEDVPGCAPTWNAWGESQAKEIVDEMSRAGAAVIVFEHWGVEYRLTPTQRQITLGHRLIDAGACAVVGCHPHRIEGIEFYRGAVIAYSLGNLVFDQNDSLGNVGLLLELSISEGAVVGVRGLIVESLSNFAQPRPADPLPYIDMLNELCNPLGTTAVVDGDWVRFIPRKGAFGAEVASKKP